MSTEKNKSTRILKEIVNYFLVEKLYQFDVSFNINTDLFELTFTAPVEKVPDSFGRFIEELNVPREVDSDEYYNALLGSHNKHADYTCLGKAIDKAEGKFEDGKLSLHIVRYNTK